MTRPLRQEGELTPVGAAVAGVVLQAIVARRAWLADRGHADSPAFAAEIAEIEVGYLRKPGRD
jgi:hypothetical protein